MLLKTVAAMMIVCGMFANAKNVCSFTIETFSDSSCSTSTGTYRYSVEMGKCFTSHDGGHRLKVDTCDA